MYIHKNCTLDPKHLPARFLIAKDLLGHIIYAQSKDITSGGNAIASTIENNVRVALLYAEALIEVFNAQEYHQRQQTHQGED